MTVLLAAVESGSLSKASRKLKLPLASVSRKVADLEKHLNAGLLVRSAKGLELTPAGRTYVASIKSILEQITDAERTAAGEFIEPRGDLSVTAPTMLGRLHVLPVVLDFMAAFPDVSVGLMLTDRIAHFLDDDVDVAVRVGALPDSGLISTHVGVLRRVLCASPSYLSVRSVPQEPSRLEDHNVISFEKVGSASNWSFWSCGNEIVVKIRSRLHVNSIDCAIDAALAGAGIVRSMSYQIVDHVRLGRLRTVLDDFEPPRSPVHIVFDKQRQMPRKTRAFIDFVVPRLRQRILEASID